MDPKDKEIKELIGQLTDEELKYFVDWMVTILAMNQGGEVQS